jgi:hypothetical protein
MADVVGVRSILIINNKFDYHSWAMSHGVFGEGKDHWVRGLGTAIA